MHRIHPVCVCVRGCVCECVWEGVCGPRHIRRHTCKSACVSEHVCRGPAHMCNRCVISSPGPHQRCHHVTSSLRLWRRIVLLKSSRWNHKDVRVHLGFSLSLPAPTISEEKKKTKQRRCCWWIQVWLCAWCVNLKGKKQKPVFLPLMSIGWR